MTNLDHDHRKCKDVCFPGAPLTAPKDLRCSPPLGIPLHLCHKDGIETADDGSDAKICQTGMAAVVDENIWLVKCH